MDRLHFFIEKFYRELGSYQLYLVFPGVSSPAVFLLINFDETKIFEGLIFQTLNLLIVTILLKEQYIYSDFSMVVVILAAP